MGYNSDKLREWIYENLNLLTLVIKLIIIIVAYGNYLVCKLIVMWEEG